MTALVWAIPLVVLFWILVHTMVRAYLRARGVLDEANRIVSEYHYEKCIRCGVRTPAAESLFCSPCREERPPPRWRWKQVG